MTPGVYEEVLETNPGWMEDVVRAKRPPRLPVALTRNEVQVLLSELEGVAWLNTVILCGTGLRLMECLRDITRDLQLAVPGDGEKHAAPERQSVRRLAARQPVGAQ